MVGDGSRCASERWIGLYRDMVRIRAFEERVRDLFAQRRMPGFTHLSIGQEAAAVGGCAPLRRDDAVVGTHRGHGHLIAKGGSMDRLMAELYGKRTGCCKGKGGSMHVADMRVNCLGANGVVGGQFPLAAGLGLAVKQRRGDQAVVCFFGDGAANRGTFHEGLNLCAIWKLPVVFVCENNGWASSTSQRYASAVADIADRARGYGIPGDVVDGSDVVQIAGVMDGRVARARHGDGPSLVEVKLVRFQGHYEGDPQAYRDRDEVRRARSEQDPIEVLFRRLRDCGGLDDVGAKTVRDAAEAEVDAAVAFAESSPLPDPAEAFDDVYKNPWPGFGC